MLVDKDSPSLTGRSSIGKTKTRASEPEVSQTAGNVTKLKKKKFSIFSLARKSFSPKKAARAAENVSVTAH